mmetsp:Transcript_2097/g.2913  ORF Transcript_2097/g.2913 Transcript_2097/m.2913 type:complete len:106 (+) Transcript_2097:330-647(+)
MKCTHCELKSADGTPDGATEGVEIGALVIGASVGLPDGNVEGVSDGASEARYEGLAEGTEDNLDCRTHSCKGISIWNQQHFAVAQTMSLCGCTKHSLKATRQDSP